MDGIPDRAVHCRSAAGRFRSRIGTRLDVSVAPMDAPRGVHAERYGARPSCLHLRVEAAPIPTVYVIRWYLPGTTVRWGPLPLPGNAVALRWVDPLELRGRTVGAEVTIRSATEPLHIRIEPLHMHTGDLPAADAFGWLDTEYFLNDPSRPFRWIYSGRAGLTFPPARTPQFLQIVARPMTHARTVWMRVCVDNREVAAVPMEPDWCVYRIVLTDTGPIAGRILIAYEPAYTPISLGVAPDPRILGAMVHQLAWGYTVPPAFLRS